MRKKGKKTSQAGMKHILLLGIILVLILLENYIFIHATRIINFKTEALGIGNTNPYGTIGIGSIVTNNLLINPSFEDIQKPKSGYAFAYPTVWFYRGNVNVSPDTTVYHTGKVSLKVVGPLPYTYSQENVNLKPKTKYEVNYWVKAQNVQGTGVGARYAVFSTNAVPFTGPTVNGTTDWKKVTYTFTTPATNPQTGRFDVFWELKSGSAWIDDVSLCENSCNIVTSVMSPTPSSTLPVPPTTANSKLVQATDGTWCYDADGNSPKIYPNGTSGSALQINVSLGTESFCQDNTGIYKDFCESGTSAKDYYCQVNSDRTGVALNTKCQVSSYQCSAGSYIGDTCVRGACAPLNSLSPQSTTPTPTTYTLKGDDGTYCYDNNGNGNILTKGTCQDNKGIYANYCSSSNIIHDYYCTGDWNGSVYNNVRCQAGTNGCTTVLGMACQDGACNTTGTPLTVAFKRVFVTSTQYQGDLGGLNGADTKCQAQADSANLGGVWKAWLSDSNASASSRLNHFNGPYVRLDNLVIANNWNDLIAGKLQNPIYLTEKKTFAGSSYVAWTGTDPLGNKASVNCNNWTTKLQSTQGGTGYSSVDTSYWTQGLPTSYSCDYKFDLYCFEQ